MSTAGMFKVTAACPTYEGKNFPFWKNKMQMHLQAIDNDLWYIVENGVPIISSSVTAADVKKFKQLDSQAKNTICGHLSKGQYGRVNALGLANKSGIGCPNSMKEYQPSATLILMFFAISSIASRDMTMKAAKTPLIASLAYQTNCKHWELETSLITKL